MVRKARPPRNFSDDDKRAALRLAAEIGVRPAARELELSLSAIARWKKQFPELWSDLTSGRIDDRPTAFAQTLDELAEEYADVEREALERAAKLLPRADGKEVAALMKGLSTGRATAIAGSQRLRGVPDETSELRVSFPQIEQALEALLGSAERPALPTYEGTAEDA